MHAAPQLLADVFDTARGTFFSLLLFGLLIAGAIVLLINLTSRPQPPPAPTPPSPSTSPEPAFEPVPDPVPVGATAAPAKPRRAPASRRTK